MNKLKENKIVEKPWGKEIWFAQVAGKYMGKEIYIKPGHRTSLHSHKKKEETIYVASGVLFFTCLDEKGKEMQCRYGFQEKIHVEPGTLHSLGAGHQGVRLFEVSTCHPDDSVRHKDYYKRPCNG